MDCDSNWNLPCFGAIVNLDRGIQTRNIQAEALATSEKMHYLRDHLLLRPLCLSRLSSHADWGHIECGQRNSGGLFWFGPTRPAGFMWTILLSDLHSNLISNFNRSALVTVQVTCPCLAVHMAWLHWSRGITSEIEARSGTCGRTSSII